MSIGFRRGLSFNPSSSTTNDNHKVNSDNGPAVSMGSLANSMNNDDYSDFEEDDAPNSFSERSAETDKISSITGETTQKSSVKPAWLKMASSSTPSSMPDLERYGIGAQLMMKMGYQKGKGLGANGEGIVNPIETKQRPQGLGVGGVREKVGKDNFDASSSDEEDDVKLKHLHKPEYDLFSLIEELEMKGIDVPSKYKELSDSKRPGEEDSDIIESFQKLKLINDNWDSLVKQERFLQYQKESITEDLKSHNRGLTTSQKSLQVLKKFQTDVDMSSSTPILINATQMALNELVDIHESQTLDSFDIVISLLSDIVATLMARFDLFDHTGGEEIVLALTGWCDACKRYLPLRSKTRLNQWDSLIYASLVLKLNELIDGEDYSSLKHQDVLEFLDFWFNSPILIDAISTLGFLVNTNFESFLKSQIKKWDFTEESDFTPSHYLIDLGNSLLWKLDTHTYSSILYQVNDKFGSFFDLENDLSIWSSLDSELSIKNAQDKIDEYLDTWQILYSSLLRSDQSSQLIKSNLKKLRKSSIEHTIQRVKSSTIRTSNENLSTIMSFTLGLCQDIRVFNREQSLLWSQFSLFNPWIFSLVDLLNSDIYTPQEIAKWVKTWVDILQHSISRSKTEYFFEMADWYVDLSINLINDRADSSRVIVPDLPNIEGDSAPSAIKILRLIDDSNEESIRSSEVINVEGIPSYKLMTSFKDVVSSYCSSNDILFLTTTGKYHPTLGLPLHRLEFKSGSKRDAYIQDDVLWLGGPNSSSFQPISVNSLSSLS